MKAVAYSIKSFEKELLIKANKKKHDITLISNRLTADTVSYAEGKDAVLVFTNDDLSSSVLQQLKKSGVKYISTRSTGTDHIDLTEAAKLGIKVANIPSYSPESIAEHAIALMLALCRNILPAHHQMMEYNFTLDNLVGTTIRNKTIGIVGFGQTGQALVRILQGFGARVLVSDIANIKKQCLAAGAEQAEYEDLIRQSDIISFHVPLTEKTRHMVNTGSIEKMKNDVMLINVSRGAIFNSEEVFQALQKGKISKIGMDVYEFEHGVFFFEHYKTPIHDQLLKAFIQNSRVLMTPHEAFLTTEALEQIAEKTIMNLDLWDTGKCVGPACCCAKDCVTSKKIGHGILEI
ncbi:MAG TPA: 2-hydroxyacid dehydrogenase [Sphingobacteriaceae bacterium]|nr:2-hydroxyacid dehydrogenase [Sphingobacteriaceae bacterium]